MTKDDQIRWSAYQDGIVAALNFYQITRQRSATDLTRQSGNIHQILEIPCED